MALPPMAIKCKHDPPPPPKGELDAALENGVFVALFIYNIF